MTNSLRRNYLLLCPWRQLRGRFAGTIHGSGESGDPAFMSWVLLGISVSPPGSARPWPTPVLPACCGLGIKPADNCAKRLWVQRWAVSGQAAAFQDVFIPAASVFKSADFANLSRATLR